MLRPAVRTHDATTSPAEVGAHADPPKKTAREALDVFLREAAMGWGRRELAAWLMCHYGQAVMVAWTDDDTDNGLSRSRDESGVIRSIRPICEVDVVELVCVARSHALALLEDLRDHEQAERLGRMMIARGLVMALRDSGAVWYVPVHRPRMRLAQRLETLLIADYLNAPCDYRRARL